jgi:hypothetical protein
VASDKSIWFVYSSRVPSVLFTDVLSTGSGSLPHAKTPTRLPSSRGSMVA